MSRLILRVFFGPILLALIVVSVIAGCLAMAGIFALMVMTLAPILIGAIAAILFLELFGLS